MWGPRREVGQRAPECRLSPFSSCILVVHTHGDHRILTHTLTHLRRSSQLR